MPPKELVLHKTHLRKASCYIGDKLQTRKNMEMRLEVNVKVKVTQDGMPKRNKHTKFGIPTSNNIGDMFQTQLF